MDAGRRREACDAHGEAAGAGDTVGGRGARLCAFAAEGDSAVHAVDHGCRSPLVPTGRRTWRVAPTFGERIYSCARGRPRSVAERCDERELDMRRHLSARVGPGGGRDSEAAGIYAQLKLRINSL